MHFISLKTFACRSITVEEMEKTKHGSSVKKMRKWSSSTHQNTSKQNFPDLISALPDSVLLHILSFLYMGQVIETSLLSRRWRYLWKSIPCICIEPPFLSPRMDMTNYIDKCLCHHEGSKIRKLHIYFFYKDTHASLADSWLHFAMKCKVEDFSLDLFGGDDDVDEKIPSDQFYRLPRSLYLCTTLTTLYLRACNLNLPDSFQLDSLKKLSLDLIELNPDSIEHLSSNCPVLEDIYLGDCNIESDLNIVITNKHVKGLEIYHYGQYGSCNDNVKINAPTLLSLVINDCNPSVRFHVQNLASLMSVDIICLGWLISWYEDVYLEPDSDMNCFEKLLYDLRHVKHLKLCIQCVQVFSLMKLKSSDIFSISATCLELSATLEKWEFPGISYLLESCSNLETLKIVNAYSGNRIRLTHEFLDKHDFEEDEYWALFETDITSTMQNLKIIEIDLEDTSRHEEFVRFLLKNAKRLESMVINTSKGYDKYNYERLFKFSQMLNAFPRSSPNAKLFIT